MTTIRDRFEPLKTLWLSPYRTTQILVDDPNGHRVVWMIAVFYGIPYAVSQAITGVPSARGDWLHFLGLIPAGILSSLLFLYLSGWSYCKAGQWLGGSGKTSDLRIATALSWAPLYLSFPIDIALFFFLKINGVQGEISAEIFRQSSLVQVWGVFQLFVCLASFLYLVPTLSASHRFSKIRAFGTVILGTALLGVVAVVILFPFYLLFGPSL